MLLVEPTAPHPKTRSFCHLPLPELAQFLQAITNILAEYVRRRREIVEGKVVFSNLLNVDDKSVFFLQSWRKCYRQYLDQISRVYTHGYKWVAYFDLAAFYDTISHELLLKTVYPNTKLGPNAETICGWLKHWITPRKTWPLQHGIPQGPQSSDFLAEIFLLPIDEAMLKKRCYLRYVDDIRLFGRTEFEVQAAVQELESLCRDRGLIPQGKKFAVVALKSLRDALGKFAEHRQRERSVGGPGDDRGAGSEVFP